MLISNKASPKTTAKIIDNKRAIEQIRRSKLTEKKNTKRPINVLNTGDL